MWANTAIPARALSVWKSQRHSWKERLGLGKDFLVNISLNKHNNEPRINPETAQKTDPKSK